MEKREEKKGDYLEIGSEHDSSVGDNCMIEQVVRQPHSRYCREAKGCYWASPDSNQNEDKSIYENIHKKEKKLK